MNVIWENINLAKLIKGFDVITGVNCDVLIVTVCDGVSVSVSFEHKGIQMEKEIIVSLARLAENGGEVVDVNTYVLMNFAAKYRAFTASDKSTNAVNQ